MAKKRTSRIYTRTRGGATRYYADFRDYTDVGGGREALRPTGAKVATDDPDIAAKLVADRLEELEQRRRNKSLIGVEQRATLGPFASLHLVEKARAGNVEPRWLKRAEMHLKTAIEFLGAERELESIRARDIRRYVAYLQKRDNGRGGTLGSGSVRKYLWSLSNLYRRAQSEDAVPAGYNPVAALIDKPQETPQEARWLEIHEAALLLESARTYTPTYTDNLMAPLECIYPLLATFLLTGGRRAEVLGLEVGDVSFDRRTVTFRPNRHRRLKTRTSHRSVPLWPQLGTILGEYLEDGPRSGLLFRSARTRGMIRDTRKALDSVAKRVGWQEGEIRTRIFRHSYTACRLQTLDRAYPVSPYTVAKELGHGGRAMVDRVYGHLGEIRHRSEVVEYRVTQHVEQLGDRLQHLRLVS